MSRTVTLKTTKTSVDLGPLKDLAMQAAEEYQIGLNAYIRRCVTQGLKRDGFKPPKDAA